MVKTKEKEFLKESNKIEGEYSAEALEDAIKAWTMACLSSDDFKKKQKNGLRGKYKKIKLKLPSYKVHTKCHNELEKRLKRIENKRKSKEKSQ